MDITITISDDVTAKLSTRGADCGQTVVEYVARLVAESVSKRTIDEIFEPVRRDFATSRMSEDELTNFGRGVIEEVRRDRAARSARE